MVERLQITMRTFDFNVSIEEGDLSAWAEWSSPWSCEPPETGRDTYFRCIGHFRRVQLFSQRKSFATFLIFLLLSGSLSVPSSIRAQDATFKINMGPGTQC
ncbi:hypothetical protein TNIN_115561 [Trichonephila inaurata madagascariensis]|uniref:Uncharacterized protein n=1 Tax=Trichonephila inaurata madagascariensis TaxID=2747483 RepID=A0A8X7C1F6_9ARAC|nr:hypothetical protein TNIN_115561 [Trichonephila inaurata madagascariensis]